MSQAEPLRCINCNIRLVRIRRHALLEENLDIVNIFKLWTYPRNITNMDHVCHACWELAQVATLDDQAPVQRQLGHTNICVVCGRSILRTDRRTVLRDPRENISDVIIEWIQPRQVGPNDQACVPCWLRAKRVTLRQRIHDYNREQNSPVTEESENNDIDTNSNSENVEPNSENIYPDSDNVDYYNEDVNNNICVNCETQIPHGTGHNVHENNNVMDIIKLWTYPRDLTNADYICDPCWELAFYHQHTCISCGAEIHDNEHFIMNPEITDEQRQIVQVINLRIQPRQVTNADVICMECWGEAQHVHGRNEERLIRMHTITLPNIRRVPETPRYCLFNGCRNAERNRIPDHIRRKVLIENYFYLPRGSRVCNYHLHLNMYANLYAAEYSMDVFNSRQIEDMIFILTENLDNTFFHDIDSIPDHLVHYWIGLTKTQHREILDQTPRLRHAMQRGSLALTALLCKLRTGDSGDRLSTLFQVPRRTLETLMDIAREILYEDFVPLHLGLGHITHQEVVQKNSIIAEGLFGNPGAPLEQKNAIVIADGTYIYTQKSANYLFQKNTYSLHKYRNLVKPFLIVCCDGYIIDVFGPYGATVNDANIMNDLMVNDNFTDFFKQDDVFVLDRGFRDCIDKINDKGFEAHMPETLTPGSSQLTTLQGNKSRCVTINRWVVEAVNGQIKRDFKLFRQEYFNRACPHLFKDLKIAAALLNCFGTRFSNPRNADEILHIINERIFLDNTLAVLVAEQRLNRRNAYFRHIDAANIVFPRMSMEDLVLFACGTYQIKQARSYVGEHFRFHGIYTLSVCREHINFNLGGENPFLIRAQIKSRHVGRRTYFVFVAVEREQQGRNAIIGYCCNCIVGLRTIGCCSHVMSVIWYLGYARHEGTAPPAEFLDNVLLSME